MELQMQLEKNWNILLLRALKELHIWEKSN